MPREDGDVDLGDDRVVVADDAGKQLLAGLQLARKLSWISCLTVFDCQPLERSSASVEGLVVVEVGIAARR